MSQHWVTCKICGLIFDKAIEWYYSKWKISTRHVLKWLKRPISFTFWNFKLPVKVKDVEDDDDDKKIGFCIPPDPQKDRVCNSGFPCVNVWGGKKYLSHSIRVY